MDDIGRNWEMLVGLLPPTWRERARSSNAVERLRGFKDIESLLHCLLIHVGCGYSLRETAASAMMTNLAHVSDVTLLDRLRKSEEWLQQMCQEMLRDSGVALDAGLAGRQLRVVDATHVKEPGKTGTQWRIHYSMKLPQLSCDHFAITPVKGPKTHDRFDRFPTAPGELLLGDRGFCRAREIGWVRQQGADVLVRVGTISMEMFNQEGQRLNWLELIESIKQAGEVRQWPAWIRPEAGQPLISGRICAIRKSEEAIRLSHRKVLQRQRAKGHKARAATYKSAACVVVFTTLPAKDASAEQVLECYRTRWQIELVFKRLKTLMALGHVPKHDERSSRAWLYGKLLVALLAEKLRRMGSFSPWGYRIGADHLHAEPVA